MRSGLTESRPASSINTSRSWSNMQPPTPSVQQPPATPRRQWTFAPHEGWLPLLLLTIAVGTVVYSVTAAITISHTNALWTTTILGLLAGLFVSKARVFPQVLLHLGACISGYWIAIFATSSAYQISMEVLLTALRSILLGGLTQAGSQNGDIAFLFYLSFLCFFLGYFGSWLVYRAHLPWLVALVYTSIMLVNLNYIAKQDLSFLVIILVGALILLIARVQLASQLTQWKNDGLHTDKLWLRTMRSRFLTIATLFVVLILPLSWLLPVASQPVQGTVLWHALNNAWTNVSHGHLPSLTNPGSLFNTYDPPADFFSDQLSITGSVNLPTGPVLSYTSSDQQGHYLEGFSYDTFDGHIWTSLTSGISQSYSANAQLPIDNTDASYTPLTTSITIIQPPGGTKHFIFAPPAPGSFNVPVTLFTDNTGDFVSAWTQTTGDLSQNEAYDVNSELVNAPVSDISQILPPTASISTWASDQNYSPLMQYYLQKPDDLSSEVASTARLWTQGARSAYNIVSDLQAHLSNSQEFTYSLNNDPVPSNVDAVTWLLHTRKGFCTYYATAMVIMARLLGIPARMVNGFSQGHYDPLKHQWVVDGDDAHSWVQVYFPNYGWISFDPTPGFSTSGVVSPNLTPAPHTTPAPVASSPTATPGKSTPTVHQTSTANGGGHTSSPTGMVPTSGILLIAFALLVLLASVAALYLAILRYRKTQEGRATVVTIYARLCRMASLIGSPPALWQTPYEYTFALSRRFPQASSALRQLADLFVRERWAAMPPTPVSEEKRALDGLWPRLRNTMLRALLTRDR